MGKPRRATLTLDYQRDWPAYFDAVRGLPARETLVLALDLFEQEDAGRAKRPRRRTAIDIGCGEGRDFREMLSRRGPTRWLVVGYDASEEAVRRLRASASPGEGERWWVHLASMEDLARVFKGDHEADGCVDLVNASFALPFCEPASFGGLWSWIGRVLKPGGRFAGQFFGDRDEWAHVRPRSHRTRAGVKRLLRGFELERFDEVEKDGDDAMGGMKHHHVFHVVARRV